MTELNRRELIAAIAAIAAVSAVPVSAQSASGGLDLSAGRAIGAAFLAANPRVSVSQLKRTHLPRGLDRAALQQLKLRSAADFRAGRIFVHEGWHLSRTEAELFALLTVGRA